MDACLRTGCRLLLGSVALAAALAPTLPAQDSTNDVHVLPRTSPRQRAPDLKANVDLVLVPCTVLDHSERMVKGLKASDFTVLDGKVVQEIRYFSAEDTPLSLTVVLDASGSMRKKLQQARAAASQLFRAANPRDEFRLMTFGNEPHAAVDLADPVEDVEMNLDAVSPRGSTALWDTIYFAIADFKRARFERKAIVLITDGGDNRSRHSQSEIRSLLRESGALVYVIGVFSLHPETAEEKAGPLLLDEVASASGGRLFSIYDTTELPRAVDEISLELRNQYVLGYYPSNRDRDGKWRKIRVRLRSNSAGARVYARRGYYGPTE